jgi:large subunit ribosomal protein L10
MFVFQHNNLTVKEFTQIRQDLAGGASKLTVLRAGVMASVLRSTEFANLEPLVSTGPTCVLTTDDDASLKSITDILTKNKKMVLLGGKMDRTLLTQDDVTRIVQLPGLDYVRAELVGTIEAPARKLLRTLEAPANEVHSILDRRI